MDNIVDLLQRQRASNKQTVVAGLAALIQQEQRQQAPVGLALHGSRQLGGVGSTVGGPLGLRVGGLSTLIEQNRQALLDQAQLLVAVEAQQHARAQAEAQLLQAVQEQEQQRSFAAVAAQAAQQRAREQASVIIAQKLLQQGAQNTLMGGTAVPPATTACSKVEPPVPVNAPVVTSLSSAPPYVAAASASGGVPTRSSVKPMPGSLAARTEKHRAKGGRARRPKKPKDMPKRPLSAYNIFFREERSKILSAIPGKEKGHSSTSNDEGASGKRKPHGKIGFEHLAKVIGRRWKVQPPCVVDHYRAQADQDMVRYKAEMRAYKNALAAKQKENEIEQKLKKTKEGHTTKMASDKKNRLVAEDGAAAVLTHAPLKKRKVSDHCDDF